MFARKYRSVKYIPVLSVPLLLCAGAVLIYRLPGVTECLQYGRTEIMAYQFFRLVTGHFTHWTAPHMWFDTFFFFLLSYLCIIFKSGDALGVGRYACFLLILALGVSGVLFFCYPNIQHYRGLSGLDWGLYGILSIQLWTRPHWVWKTGALLMVVVFAIKMALQFKLGHSLFVRDMGPGVVNMPGVHVAGMIFGVILAFLGEKVWARRRL